MLASCMNDSGDVRVRLGKKSWVWEDWKMVWETMF